MKLRQDIRACQLVKVYEIFLMCVDGNELDLEFYLTSKDIEEINEIRHLLQDFFMNKDRHYFQNTYFSLWNSIQDLFKKERVLYIPQEKWEDRFKQE